jgi:membrane protein YqaA with SNARE-associated domain
MEASLSDESSFRPASVTREPELPHMRLWFVAFLVWMGGLAALALLVLGGGEHTSEGAAFSIWILALMGFYLSLCNVFLPLPTSWIVLLAASPRYALVPNPWANIVLVAAVAAAGTVMANLNEYHILAYMLRFGLGRRVQATRVYGWAARWFDRAPFLLLALIGFFPIPVDAVRWLAILRRYSRTRFALAYFVGRGPRYLVFAGCSTLAAFTPAQILLIQVGLVVAGLVGRVVWRVVRGGGSVVGHDERSDERDQDGDDCGVANHLARPVGDPGEGQIQQPQRQIDDAIQHAADAAEKPA